MKLKTKDKSLEYKHASPVFINFNLSIKQPANEQEVPQTRTKFSHKSPQ